jgi:radial spoke head protein 4A
VVEPTPTSPPADELDPNDEAQPAPVPMPKAKTKIVPPLPREARSGTNKYVYYVCSHGMSIQSLNNKCSRRTIYQASRRDPRKHANQPKDPKILFWYSKLLYNSTGDLTKNINSYPAFRGAESQLLRCQIARISAATVVSPLGYYTFDPDGEDGGADGEAGGNAAIIINTEYEGLTNENLLVSSNWVHHTPYVLPQVCFSEFNFI